MKDEFKSLISEPGERIDLSFTRLSPITKEEVITEDSKAIVSGGGGKYPRVIVDNSETFTCDQSGSIHTYGDIMGLGSKRKGKVFWCGLNDANEVFLGIQTIQIDHVNFSELDKFSNDERLQMFRTLREEVMSGRVSAEGPSQFACIKPENKEQLTPIPTPR